VHRILDSKYTVATTVCLFALAVACNAFQGFAPFLPGSVLSDLNTVAVAHGPNMPPDPWEVNRIAHGPNMPPDPWEVNRIAHGPNMPPDPWEVNA
jgi:hypothetical protein